MRFAELRIIMIINRANKLEQHVRSLDLERNFIDYYVQYLINRNLSLIQMVNHVEKESIMSVNLVNSRGVLKGNTDVKCP